MRTGFTLIELMIVVVIIGILAAIAIPKFTDVSDSAETSACRSNLRTLASQEVFYMANHANTYTATLSLLGFATLGCPASRASLYLLDISITPAGESSYSVTCPVAPTSHGTIYNGLLTLN